MFSSGTKTLPNQFYSSSSSSSVSPLFLNNHEAFSASASADIFLQPAAFSLLPNNLLTATLLSAETLSNINTKQDIHCYNIDQNQMNGEFCCYKQPPPPPPQESEMQQQTVFVSQKKGSKKDRHSKIYTSQGLRDRRVRLSIDIARRFFDLQDMLGFDKASKTLGWLLSKSKTAIRKLDKARRRSPSSSASASSSSSSSSFSSSEALSAENGLIGTVSSGGKNEKKPKKRLEKYTKESRVKARERARERTRIKMLKQHSLPNQELPNPNPNPNPNANNENFIEEAIVIKRKLKPPPSSSSSTMVGYQQNLVMLRDLNCNNNNFNSPNFTPNWEFNNAIARSSFCAITNMNRSAGMHLYGKVQEADNGTQILH